MFRRRQGDEIESDEGHAPLTQDAAEATDPGQDSELDEGLAEDTTADLESQAADFLADNDLWVYGPQAQDVLDVLDLLENMGPGQAKEIAEAWNEVGRPEREKAHKAVARFYESDKQLRRYISNARDEVSNWLGVMSPFPAFVAAAPDWPKWAQATAEAAADAAAALILNDEIEEPVYDTLLLPWADTIERLRGEERLGAPELPEKEGDDSALPPERTDFGPNSDLVADFLNRLWLLTPYQVDRLASAFSAGSETARKKAHQRLQAIVDDSEEYREQVRRAQAEISPWLNGQGESRKVAGLALTDAAAALVLGDLLTAADGRLLYAPWFDLMGAPPLPESTAVSKPRPSAGPADGGDAGSTASAPAKSPAPAKSSAPAKWPAPAKSSGQPDRRVKTSGPPQLEPARSPDPARQPPRPSGEGKGAGASSRDASSR